MMSFSDKPAVKALVAYLSSDLGGQKWAEVGFNLTPNKAGTNSYTDPVLLKSAQILVGAKAFTPDIGDSISVAFQNAEWKAIIDYVGGGDLDTALNDVAQVQADSLSQ